MITNTLPHKSRKPEKPHKIVIAAGVVEDLLSAFYKLFSLLFCVSSDQ